MTGPKLSDPVALRLPDDVLERIETIAKATDRTRSWVMVRALRQYLAGEGGEILAALDGRAEIAAGASADMDDTLAEMEAIARGKVA